VPANTLAPQPSTIDFRTAPDRYRHWRLRVEPPLAWLTLDVDEAGGLLEGYELKQNSYDLGVDIELFDATQRLRFEHPEVKAVIVGSGRERIFCAGANIRMLGVASHQHKVNFCKFTNETRLAIEDACRCSGQRYLCAVRGTAAGGGYELALATDHIVLADDGSSAVSLPEVPLLGVLPGTGGLTRVIDKRKVRRDLADRFCTLEEGVKGRRALEWRLVDELAPRSRFDAVVEERALDLARTSDRPAGASGVVLAPLRRELTENVLTYEHLRVELDRERGLARLVVLGPTVEPPHDVAEIVRAPSAYWPLAAVRELDDALLHLRFNEPRLGLLVLASEGDLDRTARHDAWLLEHRDHWLVREIVLFWKRTLKRFDVSARTLFALVEPGSCFAGLLAELVFAADRAYMFAGERAGDGRRAPALRLSESNFGPLPMPNGLGRLQTRFLGEPERLVAAREAIGRDLGAAAAEEAGLVTVVLDEIDWDDEVRVAIEERSSFSADALSGLEANLRFPGPETLETKIFGRLSAWQNWIFGRPNATGEAGALKRYGTGVRPDFDPERV
jgi:benzoyl-CoA-dihydrodiol lyase